MHEGGGDTMRSMTLEGTGDYVDEGDGDIEYGNLQALLRRVYASEAQRHAQAFQTVGG